MINLIVDINKPFIDIDEFRFSKIDLKFEAFDIEKHYQDERKYRYTLHYYGDQLFCKFRIVEKVKNAGIYFFVFGNEIKYLGECENLYSRINNGYGNISPRNCYVGGQLTNCKINGLINSSKNNGVDVSLYFCETEMDSFKRKRIESNLIKKLNTISHGYNDKG